MEQLNLMTVAQIAQLSGRTASNLYNLINKGKIPGPDYPVGNFHFYSGDKLEQLLSSLAGLPKRGRPARNK